jgi:hypothetical protein
LNYVDINIEDRISLRNKFSSLFSSLIKNESPQLQKRNKYKVFDNTILIYKYYKLVIFKYFS